ncbi:hypothetical protein O1D19_002276 [Vibrio cholerae]|nr:hypothetical protein [Vibrio cholerae]
MLDVCLSYAFA